MQSIRPQPLVEPYVDLREFAYMPFDVSRFRDSDFAATIGGDAFRAGILLWCTAWHQVPAASLPTDDRVLANLAGYGRFIDEWLKVKEGALYGWILCSDDRYYHPTIAEKATESYASKIEHQYKRFYDRMRKSNQKLQSENKPTHTIPSLEEWCAASCPKIWVSLGIPKESKGNSKTVPQNQNGIPQDDQGNSNGKSDFSNGNNQNSNGKSKLSNGNTENSAGNPQNSALNRREYKGEGKVNNNSSSCSSDPEKISKMNLGAARYYSENQKRFSIDQLLEAYPVKNDFLLVAKNIIEFHSVTEQQILDAWNSFESWAVQAEAKTAHKWMVTFLSKFVQDAVHNKPKVQTTAQKPQANHDVNAAWQHVQVPVTQGRVQPVPLPEDMA